MMMNDIGNKIAEFAEKTKLQIVFLEPGKDHWILCDKSDRKTIAGFLKKQGFKGKRSAFRNDKYLYGTDPFMKFEKAGQSVVLVCQIACRSTLHGEWVPLDRKINLDALQRIRRDQAGIPLLSYEDELCYLLAKGVYTEKAFSEDCRKRIGLCMKHVQRDVLLPKLEGVFFCFTEKMLVLLEQERYEDIIPALWRFAEY